MNKRFMLGMVSLLVLLSMLAMAVAGRSRFPLVNGAVAFVVLPLESCFTALGRTSDGLRAFWKSLTVLESENERLKTENIELRTANIRAASLFAENRQLRELLAYKEQNPEEKLVAARVIARSYGDLRDTMYIDAGRDKGLEQDMAVVGGGLIGVVDEVYGAYARVLLLSSPRCKVGGRVLRVDSRAVGIIRGQSGQDSLVMEHVYRDASVRQGDVVVTNGYSGSHPADILIGTVISVSMDSLGLLKEVEIAPAADIADIEHVLVIVDFAPKAKIDSGKQGGRAQ